MRYRREDVVARALQVLDDYGLADLTMRRLGTELGVRPSALYHHFANKQSLLAAVADEILLRGRHEPSGAWDVRVTGICTDLRDSLLASRDGAEVVATVWAFGLGATQPHDDLATAASAISPRLPPAPCSTSSTVTPSTSRPTSRPPPRAPSRTTYATPTTSSPAWA